MREQSRSFPTGHTHNETWHPFPRLQSDEIRITGVYKGTVVRGEAELTTGAVHLSDCHDAVIYLLAPLQVGGMVCLEGC